MRRNKRPEKYDDTNFAVLNALNYELTQAEQETIASKIQSSLESATDTYLDTWGDWFGVYRKDGWDDEYYRARIIRELLLKRGTIPAIIDALVDFLNDNDAVVQIYEPWRNIFYTNKSKLNGDDHLMGYYYRFAIIDISIDRPFPPEIVEIIKAFKPAGVLFYLRLDTSLDKNKTTVESPYVYLDVTNKTELEFLNGLYYDLRGNINLSDQRTQVVGNNIFHTNNSKLNGEDVLAGAFNHGRGYVHLASTTLLDYTPKATDSMSNLKTTLGEAGSDMYNQTKEKDGRTASIQVPATKNVHTLYSNSLDFGDYDYSTAPNLLPTLDYSKLSKNGSALQTPLPYIKDYGDYFVLDANDASADGTSRNCFVPLVTRLTKGKTYTLSVSMMVDDEFANNQSYYKSPLYYTIYTVNPAASDRLATIYQTAEMRNQWKRVSKVFTVPADQKDGDYIYLQLYQVAGTKGKLYVRYDMMIQEGDQTSSQAPANQLSKVTTDKWHAISAVERTEEEGNITSFKYPATTGINKIAYLQNDRNLIPLLSDKKQYTLSAEVWLEKEVNAPLVYRVNDRNGTGKVIMDANTINVPAKQWTEVSVTKTLDLPSNPNLIPALKASDFKPTSGATVEDVGNGIQVTFSKTDGATFLEYIPNLPGLKANTKYTMSADITVKEGYTGKLENLRIYYRKFPGGTGIINMWATNAVVGQKTQIKVTENSSANTDPTEYDRMYLTIHTTSTEPFVGTVLIENLKVEEGETVTPDYPDHWVQVNAPESYEGIIKIKNDSIKIQEGAKTTKPAWKPNLLDAPYYLSKMPLGENIADPKKVFPIKTSAYNIYLGKNTEKYQLNQTYTITMKATKPATQQFSVFLLGGAMGVGNMKPVEGLTDVWELTFKVTQAHIDAGITDVLSLYQLPQSTVGACQIDWLKIEEGDTGTPNIDSYDYVGSLIEDTETPTLDPTKYTWTVNGDVTNKKAYMVFDIKTFIEENYATEFEKLVADLGEDQALNAVFENFNISTALKALVSPSNPLNCTIELFDFSTNAWHVLSSTTLDLRTKVLNLEANRVIDYLNDYRLLFVRYSFTNVTSKDVTVELDMLNILFNYRLGDGYSVGLQSKVETLTDIPASNVSLSKESLVLGIGESEAVTATLLPANATNTNLEWLILDPNIAKVSSSGNITGLSEGKTKLIVYGDDRNVSAECDVKVVIRPTAITLDKETININI